MSPTLLAILLLLKESAKENRTGPVACCWCNNRNNFIKYGTYRRYRWDMSEMEAIQRYRCKHDRCRRTFSILPHPFLRISRFTLCIYDELLRLLQQELSKAKIARWLGVAWPTAARRIEKAHRIQRWIRQEEQCDPSWAPSPCMHPGRCWSDFIRAFAAKFYPRRYAEKSPTQYVYLL